MRARAPSAITIQVFAAFIITPCGILPISAKPYKPRQLYTGFRG
jgi:hypothetical protein